MDVVSLLNSTNEQLKITLVTASHDLDFLTKISDRIILLKGGTIAVDIDPRTCDAPIDFLKKYY
jgi:polar amino acid transport system ATP-binding protein